MATVRKLNDRFETVGLVEPDDRRYEAIKSRNGYRGVPRRTLDEVLKDDDVDVVAIETEVKNLLTTATTCVQAGKHVHLDKPAGESLADLQRLHRLAESNGCMIQMGYMYRYNPAFQFLFSAVKSGWLGDVFEVHGVMSKKVNDGTRKQLARYPGGSMFELGCHLIDPLLHLLGTPENVTAFNRKTGSDDLLDNTFAVFEFPKATASIRSSLVEVDGFRRRQFVVCGTRGTIRILPLEPPTLELTLDRDVKGYRKGSQIVSLRKSTGRYDGAWMDLFECLQNNKEFAFSNSHDLAVQRAVLTAAGLRRWSDDNPTIKAGKESAR